MKTFRPSLAGALLATLTLALPAAAQEMPTVDTIVPNGGTSSSGTITLTDADGNSRSVAVSASGNIRIY